MTYSFGKYYKVSNGILYCNESDMINDIYSTENVKEFLLEQEKYYKKAMRFIKLRRKFK